MTTPAAAPRSRGVADAMQLLLAGCLALVLLPQSLHAARGGGLAPVWVGALVVALLGLHLAVAAAHRWPRATYVVGALACLVLLVAPDLDGSTAPVDATDYGPILLPSTLCFYPLLYSVSARTRAPWPNAALGLALAGSGLTLARLWGFTGTPIEAWAWWLMLGTTVIGGTLAAWALGRYHATRTAWTAQLAERAAADERRRIAREMHDVVAHSLAVVVSHAEAGRMVVPRSPERAAEILDTIATTGREALEEMRGLLGVLRDDDAPTEPQPGLADIPALVDRVRSAGLDVELTMAPEVDVAPAVGLTVYRIVQEALTNVTRHGGERPTARVSIEATGVGLAVHVTSTGPPGPAPSPGRGLTGMRERVETVGGSIEAGPAGGGWRVRAVVPR